MRILIGLIAGSLAILAAQRPASSTTVTLFEGARLIAGDGKAPIENSALLVQNDRIVQIGKKGTIQPPAGAARIDLTGKTVIPALIDTHVHLGYQKGLSYSADNFTRDHLLDLLHRYAYCGISVVLSLGTDPNDLPFQIRAEQLAGKLAGTAFFMTAGRGFAAPDAGPNLPELKPSAIGVTTEAEARKSVREQIAKKVDFIKIWVDDRNGTVKKLSPELYRAIIDEAHKHNTRVIAHVFYLDDAKDLVRAGIDGFAHLVRDREADDELISLLKQRHVFVMPNLAISENAIHAEPPAWLNARMLHEVASDAEIERLRSTYATRSPQAVERARDTYRRMQRTLAKLQAAGVWVGFGTDDGAARDHFYAYSALRELQLMAQAGMTPNDVITAATRNSAEFLGLAKQGTLAPGKNADFVVLEANPLENIANTEKIARVYLQGKEVSRVPQGSSATVFEGARLITGDGKAPIENSAFIVENNRFTGVGKKGELRVPAGARHIDLTGKTVIPAMVDVHSHFGFLKQQDGSMSKANFNRENLLDHLNRYAYHGFAAAISMGTDFGELPYQLREEVHPGAALFRTVGRGLAWPGSGPNDPARNDVPYVVTTLEQARKAVQDLAPHRPDFVKIWVDDRNHTQKKLTPELYGAAVDEARKHNLRAIAHVYDLEDAKGLVRAGISGFTHLVRDKDIDDEFIALLKQHPDVFFTPNLGVTSRGMEPGRPAWLDDPLLHETIPPGEIARLERQFSNKRPEALANTRASWDLQVRNLTKLRAAGVRIVLGSDSAGDPGRTMGWHAIWEVDALAKAGMTPAEVIVASTRLAAETLKLDQLGMVAPGKSADFVVLNANPLDNIANTRKIDKVYLRGQEVNRAAMRAAWTGK